MSVRTKLLIACLACALVPLIGYAGFTYARTAQHLYRLEDGQFAAREEAVGVALQGVVDWDLADVADTVAWPEFVEAVEDGDDASLRQRLEAPARRGGRRHGAAAAPGRQTVARRRVRPEPRRSS